MDLCLNAEEKQVLNQNYRQLKESRGKIKVVFSHKKKEKGCILHIPSLAQEDVLQQKVNTEGKHGMQEIKKKVRTENNLS